MGGGQNLPQSRLKRARAVGAEHGFFSVECRSCMGLGQVILTGILTNILTATLADILTDILTGPCIGLGQVSSPSTTQPACQLMITSLSTYEYSGNPTETLPAP
jgi:hypothetical protein